MPGPMVLGVLKAAGLLPGDSFWVIASFGVIPLTPSTVPVGRVPVEYYNPFDIV